MQLLQSHIGRSESIPDRVCRGRENETYWSASGRLSLPVANLSSGRVLERSCVCNLVLVISGGSEPRHYLPIIVLRATVRNLQAVYRLCLRQRRKMTAAVI